MCAIVSGGSGLVVDCLMSGAPGLPLVQSTLDGSTWQQWVLGPFAGPDAGYYRITTLGVRGGLVFDVQGASIQANAKVQTYPWNQQANQKWRLVGAPLGAFKIENQNSGMLLTVSNLSKSGSTLVQQPQTG